MILNDIDRRSFLERISLLAGGVSLFQLPSYAALEFSPVFERVKGEFQLRCAVNDYILAVTDHWLKIAPASNPGILDMFRDRDRKPLRDMVPWAGEFAGKYLTSAVQVWRITGDPTLKKIISDFVRQLVPLQDADGYLGTWPNDSRLTGRAPNIGAKGGETWDAWGHYHIMLGLLMWHEDTKDAAALSCAIRIGDLFCNKFATARLVDTGSTEMNLAPIHSLALLYRQTLEEKYLNQALKILDEFSAKGKDGKFLAGNYLNAALGGTEFFQMPKPRWESLHPIMSLAELYWITGNADYKKAFEHIWWSIAKLDRHNNGGFSSGEQAQGNPYHKGAIETCCTIAWIALGVEMLRLSGESVAADELELATLNSVIGMHSPSGRWVTYNTPMDGVRRASAHDIVFQAREGTPELNCCSVNGARGFGMISDWALLKDSTGFVLNWYGPSEMIAKTSSGSQLRLTQETDYPKGDKVRLRLQSSRPITCSLKLRIPYWSKNTSVKVNGKAVGKVAPGSYLSLNRTWKSSDTIDIQFDFSLHFWKGEKEYEGKTSIYRGPILLTYDRRFNTVDPDQIPSLNAADLKLQPVPEQGKAIVLVDAHSNGKKIRLCDFGSAGNGGSPYKSWLAVENVEQTPFSKSNPLRSGRANR